MIENEPIRAAIDEGVKTITIDKPRCRNALTPENAKAIAEEIEKSEIDGTRVVVLAGAGGAFSAGAELTLGGFRDQAEAASRGDNLASSLDAMVDESYHRVARAIRSVTLPVIASVDGVAAGVSFSYVLASDLALASTRSRFIAVFIRIALMPDGGLTFLLPRLLGMKRAMELAMTGDEISAEQAVRLGVVNRIFPPEELPQKTSELACRLARGPRNALASIKRTMLDAESLSFEATLHEESRRQGLLMTHENCLEGVSAFFQKRPPKYK